MCNPFVTLNLPVCRNFSIVHAPPQNTSPILLLKYRNFTQSISAQSVLKISVSSWTVMVFDGGIPWEEDNKNYTQRMIPRSGDGLRQGTGQTMDCMETWRRICGWCKCPWVGGFPIPWGDKICSRCTLSGLFLTKYHRPGIPKKSCLIPVGFIPKTVDWQVMTKRNR